MIFMYCFIVNNANTLNSILHYQYVLLYFCLSLLQYACLDYAQTDY